ncbi:NADH-quinone oxidoreductase subunit NuoG [Chryseolinea sp. Jin1]|uniref:NADH-quinone oxidoreductase subunit NuoG n=1 Tax=Chryseolinea lacunae TaxID=2801331 RepID=A0ABS1KY50_9BACT|nr:NADH-quinone oxidoreductase subunit NuoG [Chryseolinea lacunae]MBL0744260.1 NADH-quinone oxidoreductase subunit NuoG [Chryseolinea lacunae]
MATVYIDNKSYEVGAGKNLLESCLSLGLDLPYFCWHPSLGSVGACRQCAVKVYKDADDKKGRLIMSCMEPVADNQRISIQDPEAKEFREHVVEWLMTNHPHDCAVCDEGGACHLQDMTVMTGHNYRHFQYKKRTYQNQYLGPFINHEMNRCIQCYRCVRFYKDYAGGKDLDAFASRNQVYFGRHEEGTLESEFSGNLAEICPTGVFTDKTLKEHYTRKWDLTNAPSICQHCSVGCNTIAGERYGELRSIVNRYNGKVNGYFLCDRGRFGYGFVNAEDRIRKPRVRHETVSRETVLEEIKRSILGHNVIGIGSPRASLQSNFVLKALVGEDNFYHGVNDNEHNLGDLVVKILTEGPARSLPLKEVENCDAVFILGEDLTNTAPMVALAVRQSVRRQPLQHAAKNNIVEWNDAAAREFIQDEKGPLFMATVHTTKLDELATRVYRAEPDNIARLGFAVAHLLDPEAPAVDDLSNDEKEQALQIANTLQQVQRPVIISGTGCGSEIILRAAANVAWALQKKNKAAGIVLTLSESNAMGLALLNGHRLQSALDTILNRRDDTVIILENDLYRHGPPSVVDEFMKTCHNVIVVDYLNTPTTQKASVVVPAGTFAESDGTVVNNEGRAQRFFQVYEPAQGMQESWRWLLNIGAAVDHPRLAAWKNFEDVTRALAAEEVLLRGVEKVTPPSSFRMAGQRIPRESHRYSGRTSMNAAINVSEPKPPEDADSSLSYTMEGYRGQAPSSMIPFFWSPGWNSVQSVNKYQDEVGHALRDGDPGVRLLEPKERGAAPYFSGIPEAFHPMKDHLLMVHLHHIYGSEELSNHSKPVAERIPQPYVMLNNDDAAERRLNAGDTLTFEVEGQAFALPVVISQYLPKGVAGMPYGLEGLTIVELPAWSILK